jgi:DNA primase
MMSQGVNFAALKERIGLEAVLEHYEVKDLRGGRSGHYRGRCPIHQGEGRDAFHVDVKRKIFHCFSCGAGGDVLDLVGLLSHCTVWEAALRLQEWFPGAGRSGEPAAKQRVTKGKSAVNAALKFTLRGVDGRHAYVAAAREIDACTAARFGVGFYGGPGLMSGRVVIPIHDESGRLVAYAGRSVDGRSPRYLFPGGFRKSQVLFNYHRATAIAGSTVLVVEGFFDCMRVSQAGFERVVALMGTELYEHPAQLLCDRFRRVALMLDGDEAGGRARSRVAVRLRESCDVRVIELPKNAQPDQLPDSRLRELIASGAGGSLVEEG